MHLLIRVLLAVVVKDNPPTATVHIVLLVEHMIRFLTAIVFQFIKECVSKISNSNDILERMNESYPRPKRFEVPKWPNQSELNFLAQKQSIGWKE